MKFIEIILDKGTEGSYSTLEGNAAQSQGIAAASTLLSVSSLYKSNDRICKFYF